MTTIIFNIIAAALISFTFLIGLFTIIMMLSIGKVKKRNPKYVEFEDKEQEQWLSERYGKKA